MLMSELIIKKRDGGKLTAEEIKFIVDGYTAGDIPDYQVSAFLMSVFFKGLEGVLGTESPGSLAFTFTPLHLSRRPKRAPARKRRAPPY